MIRSRRHRLPWKPVVGFALLCAACAVAPAAETPAYHLDVRPGWTNVDLHSVSAVLQSAAAELMRYFPGRTFRPLAAEYKPGVPHMFYEGAKPPNHRVDCMRLSATGTFWCQYVYQFAHELCHVLHNSDRGYSKQTGWFGESVCELSSLFVLRRLSETWKTRPPFPNFVSFAPHLKSYADDLVEPSRLTNGVTLARWFAEHRADLFAESCNRPLNRVVAVALLPLFEEDPARWESLTWMYRPRAPGAEAGETFERFLAEWHEDCPDRHRPFVRRLAREFGVAEPAP